jgi:hypothetical protein
MLLKSDGLNEYITIVLVCLKILYELFNQFFFIHLGIEPTGNHVDAPAKFHVETFAAGKGNVDVVVINPKGQREKVINQ